ADGIENFEIALPHARERQAIKPGIIRNKANDAVSGLFDDAPLRHTEEAHVKIVEPLALWPSHSLGLAVGLRQVALLADRDAGKAVVWRIAENDEDRRLLLQCLGLLALFLQTGKRQRLLVFGLPAGQGIREIDAGALVILETCTEPLQLAANP